MILRRFLHLCTLLATISLPPLCSSASAADERPMEVQVADPYIELHSGPGAGYPVFHVEEQDKWIEILKRKTDWFKVRTANGKQGWVAREQLVRTLTPDGDTTQIDDATQDEFSFHRWEMGAMGGEFKDADVITLFGGFFFTPNFSVELSAARVFGDFSDADMANVSLLIHPYPGWRISPFFTLGTGVIRTDAKSTLVKEDDRTDQLAHVGGGVRVYLARRFVFRAQYKNYVVFQGSNDNQEINEWNAGFAVFF
jgi:hypothetical protein